MGEKTEVIIIGSGIIGNSTAYYLAKKGVRVTVLEKSDHIGNGGSSRNGGGVRQSGRDPRELPLMMYGVKNIWPTLSEELGVDVEYYQEGNLRLGKTEAHLATLERLADNAKAVGVDVRMVTGEEARKINPYLSDEVVGASWCPTDGHANPLVTTLAYYRAARKLGVRFITGVEVLGLRKVRGVIREVITSDGTYTADKVIVAAGYASRKIIQSVGLDAPLYVEKLETLVTEAEPPMFYQMLGTATADFYGHQTTHGSFVFGGSSGLDMTNRDNGMNINSSFTAPMICRGIMGYFPCLSDVKIVRTWAGFIDDCIDLVPIISKVEEVPGLILACGFTGHGFGIGPAAGLALSQLACDEDPVCDLSDLRYDRFKAKL
ncbi:MAG: NAD(P)/FAD-dependent oxidoreductase [Wujia sp.]